MKKLTTEEFIKKARKIHGNKYDYSKVIYVDSKTKICIICPIHGEFWQIPRNHLFGNGCPLCAPRHKIDINDALANTLRKCEERNYAFLGFCDKNGKTSDFVSSTSTYLHLRCNICGNEWKTTSYHHFIDGNTGCPICGIKKAIKSIKWEVDEVIKIIKDICIKKNYTFYGFCDKKGNDSEWKNTKETYLHLKCNNCGNEWKSTTFDGFYHGSGCSHCKTSILEQNIENLFQQHKIDFEHNKRYEKIDKLELDFYLPQYKCAIECQGEQHFKPVNFGCGVEKAKERFQGQLERDSRKRRLCEENGVRLLYYSNLGIEYPYQVFENLDELLEEIKKC